MACALLGLLVGAVYLLRVNPQDQTRLQQIHIKNAALARTAGQPRLLVCGDSTVAFGLDPTVLREVTGLPTVNLGYDAGCGVLALLGVGGRAARSGDTIIVQLTAELMVTPVEPVREGRLLAMLYHDPAIALGGSPGLFPDGLAQAALTRLSLFSPTERRMVNDLGRKLLRMPGFRYENCAIDENGYFTGRVFLPVVPYLAFPTGDLKALPTLHEFTMQMQARGVRVFYALPWIYCRPEQIDKLRTEAGAFLRTINEQVPVLREAGYGLQTDPGLYADTGAHPDVEGARRRSRSAGEALVAASTSPAPHGGFQND